MFISDRQVQEAFDVLHDQAHAKARAAYEYAEKRLKVVLAKAQLTANGKTVGEREATALTSDEYEAATKTFRMIAEAYYLERDRRDAASAVIDAWRTQQSDMRAMGKVA
ncbi:hypothetical protein [Phenylobacterium sp. J367]|uniref:hypothetical protein n=1 Tax=Phenylobacterium sp. J367 TaxID=2898435 RepID=UPI002151C979|nr:hypothetical protein [Phenylobacterium sp. J367]MCR5876971.1 hypothetical protein [Phenylobacterium sp. J367]MCR5877039.1 hypothetical protein [Phenylobacterium sp. J367]